MMRRVLIALIPIYLFSIYLYGWRLLLLGVLVFTVGIGIEYFFEKTRKKKTSEAVLVTCSLYLLALPANTPWWIAILGIAFAVFIAKEVYGGFGRNIFNPAISGRLFVYITFPNQLQSGFLEPGNFGFGIDAITNATPLGLLRQGEPIGYLKVFLGFRPGSMGESSVVLILIAAIYLIATKTASWRVILSTVVSAAVLTSALFLFAVAKALAPPAALICGSLLFVAVFYATDPVSAPKQKGAQWLYGTLIGSATVLVRTFSLFPEGTSFAVLLGNTFASLLDHLMTRRRSSAAQEKEQP
jgi:Na+-transporting NADH:ubiquinone oxidoreductase subunit B